MNNQKELKYIELAQRLKVLEDKTFNLLKNFNKSEILNSLKLKLKENRERTKLKVAFVGQYNAGKSTIISALTNRKDIKIHSNVATDISSEYEWNNIRIIDTPGILAGKVEHHDITTKEALNDADLVVYVLTSQLFDDVIFENFVDLAYKQNLKDKMLIAINKMSMEKGDFDVLKKNYTDSIKTTFNEKGYDFEFEIVFMDAFDYIEGVDEKEQNLIEMSNFSMFINSLNTFIQNKGIVHKSFDTPIRIIIDEINNIALDEADPNFSLVLKKYENRFRKYKKEITKDVGFLLDDLKDKILTEGYSISSLMGEIDETQFNSKQEEFNKLLEEGSSETMQKIEDLIFEKNKLLGEELEEVANEDEVIIYTENLKNKFNKNENKEYFKSESLNGKINLLTSVKEGSEKLAKFAGTSQSANIFAKSAEVAGSQGHKAVYEIGKGLGYKFKPWEAVKITKSVGNVAKFAGPAIAIFSLGVSIYGAHKEEKTSKKVNASKLQMNAGYYEIANDVINQLNNKFDEYVANNIDSKIQDFNKQKLEIINKNEANSNFLNEFSELHGEYIDFIETINK